MGIDYQTMRGGRVVFREIAKPTLDEWGTALEALEATLELEKTVNESLLTLHKTTGDNNDADMTNFIEGNYLGEQVEAIKEIGDLIPGEECWGWTWSSYHRQGAPELD